MQSGFCTITVLTLDEKGLPISSSMQRLASNCVNFNHVNGIRHYFQYCRIAGSAVVNLTLSGADGPAAATAPLLPRRQVHYSRSVPARGTPDRRIDHVRPGGPPPAAREAP
jgi:hypothetical protein